MGFLDLFKKKKKTALPKELEGYISDIRKKAFPGGEQEFNTLVDRVINLTNGRIPEHDVRYAVGKAGSLMVISQDKTENRIVMSLTLEKKTISTDDAKVIYNVLLENFAKHMYGSESLAPVLSKSFGNIEDNPINGNHGPLGSETNPVPVCGIPASYDYVGKLELADGTPVKIKRFGSGSVDVCSETVDFYDAYDSAENVVASFVICPYCPETSKLPPEGFRFKV